MAGAPKPGCIVHLLLYWHFLDAMSNPKYEACCQVARLSTQGLLSYLLAAETWQLTGIKTTIVSMYIVLYMNNNCPIGMKTK